MVELWCACKLALWGKKNKNNKNWLMVFANFSHHGQF